MIYKIRSSDVNQICLNKIKSDIIFENPKPILWIRAGMYCIVPLAIVKNAIREYEAEKKLVEELGRGYVAYMSFHWSQGHELSPEQGRIAESRSEFI